MMEEKKVITIQKNNSSEELVLPGSLSHLAQYEALCGFTALQVSGSWFPHLPFYGYGTGFFR